MLKKFKLLSLTLIMSLIFSCVVSFGAARKTDPTDPNNPQITAVYSGTMVVGGATTINKMKINITQGTLNGKADIDGRVYSLNTNYNIKSFKSPEGGYYYEGTKLYKLNNIAETSPGIPAPSMNGAVLNATFTYTYELIPTTEHPKASHVLTVQHKDTIDKVIKEKYLVNGVEKSKEEYEKCKVGAYKEKTSTKYVKDLGETLTSKTDVFTGATEADSVITWSDGSTETVKKATYNFQVDEYYTVKQEYLKTYELTTEAASQYTITWKNWDGSVLKTQTVSKGTTPSYSGTPTRPSDSNYTYTFKGWSPTVVAANANATYTAQYTAVPKTTTQKYTITWKNWDGKVLKTQKVSSGARPSYNGIPTRAADSKYTYSFKGWTPSVVIATKDASYIATYTSKAKAVPLNVKVKIKTPKAAKAAFTAKWTKLSASNQKKVASIQIQYSQSKNFTNSKITTASKKASSKKINKLKRKTTYYIRVRTVKGSSFGPWSSVKKIKTK